MEQFFNYATDGMVQYEVEHVAVDEEGNQVKVEVLPDGTIQDTEYSDTPEGNSYVSHRP